MPRGKRNNTVAGERVANKRVTIITVGRTARSRTYPKGWAEIYPTYVRFTDDQYHCIGWIEGKSMTALAKYWLQSKGKMPPRTTKVVIPVKT